MLDYISKFISQFTDTPIYKGTGVTTTDVNTRLPLLRLGQTRHLYKFMRVTSGKETGQLYYILEHVGDRTELVIASNVFGDIFTAY